MASGEEEGEGESEGGRLTMLRTGGRARARTASEDAAVEAAAAAAIRGGERQTGARAPLHTVPPSGGATRNTPGWQFNSLCSRPVFGPLSGPG